MQTLQAAAERARGGGRGDSGRRIKYAHYTLTPAALVRAPPAVPGTKLYYVELSKIIRVCTRANLREVGGALIAMAMDVNKPGGVVIDFAKIVDKVKLWEGYVPLRVELIRTPIPVGAYSTRKDIRLYSRTLAS